MPQLSSGTCIELSRAYIPTAETVSFPCPPIPIGYFYQWVADPQTNTPPFKPDEKLFRRHKMARVPSNRDEVKAFIQVLIGRDGNEPYWRGDWLSEFPTTSELDAADQQAWESWLAGQADYLDETIEICRRQADAVQRMAAESEGRLNPLAGVIKDLLQALRPLADLSGCSAGIRVSFCGCKFNLNQLQDRGLELVNEDDNYIIGDLPLDVSGREGFSRLEARCWFSTAGHLRDLHVYAYPKNGKGGRVELNQLGADILGLEDILRDTQRFLPVRDAHIDWEILSDNKFDSKRTNVTPELQFATILERRLSDLVQSDRYLASRYVASILRFVDYWPDTHELSKIADHAVRIGLKHEAACLACHAIDRNNLNGPIWNELGCVCHFLGLPQEALRCFLMGNLISPDHSVHRTNVLLEAKPVIQELLNKRQLGMAVGMAEAVLESQAAEKPEDLAFLHGAIALGCEYFGDDAQSRTEWEHAKTHIDPFLPSDAGLNRMEWRDMPARRRALEAQLDTYPKLPQELDTGERIPTKFTKGDTHGTHWATIVPDVEAFIRERVPQMLSDGRVHGSRDFQEDELPLSSVAKVVGYEYGDSDQIHFYSLATTYRDDPEKHYFASCYPIGLKGPVTRMLVNEIKEWPDGMEAHVEVATPAGKLISFFAPHYFVERSTYRKDHLYDFRLVGFANLIAPYEEKSWDIIEGPALETERERVALEDPNANLDEIKSVHMTFAEDVAMLNPSMTYPDECGFILRVETVEWFTLEGARGCLIGTTFIKSSDGETLLGALYAMEHVLNGYEPVVGDRIEGALWLQGYLASDAAYPLNISEEDKQLVNPFGRVKEWLAPNATDKWEDPEVPRNTTQGWAISVVRHNLTMQPIVKSISILPGRVPAEPDAIVELFNGRQAYVCIRGYEIDSPPDPEYVSDWIEIRHAMAKWKGFTPVFLVHAGRKASGAGYSMEYHGMDELYDGLRKLFWPPDEIPKRSNSQG